MNPHISINLEFAQVVLPVVKFEGLNMVPLKPVSDLFGLNWKSQREKMTGEWQKELFNTSLLPVNLAAGRTSRPGIGVADQAREMLCIRLDRVEAFLFSINPLKVQAAGNADGAAYLKGKIKEWSDLMHEFEQQNGAYAGDISRARSRDLRDFIALHKAKKEATDEDRAVFAGLIKQQAALLGQPYQAELIN